MSVAMTRVILLISNLGDGYDFTRYYGGRHW